MSMPTKSEYSASPWSGRGSLEQMLAELDRQKATRVDFVADSRQLSVSAGEDGGLLLCPTASQTEEFVDKAGVAFSMRSLKQFGGRLNPSVPAKFTEGLADTYPSIAAQLINDVAQANGKRHLFRCLDGRCRAVLSDKYRIMDHYDVAFSAMQAVQASNGEVVECSLSDTHMRIKFTSRNVWDAINLNREGDRGNWYSGGIGNQDHLRRVGARSGGDLPGGPGTVHPLVTVSNSETGHGGLNVRIGLLQAICFNLATVESVVQEVHLGSKLDEGIFTEETRQKDSEAVMLKCRDAVTAAFDSQKFAAMVAKANAAQSDAIEAPTAAVNQFVEGQSLSEEVRDGILAHFLRDYDQTRYGMAQAVARYAQDVTEAEAASTLEDLAGKLIVEPSLVAAA